MGTSLIDEVWRISFICNSQPRQVCVKANCELQELFLAMSERTDLPVDSFSLHKTGLNITLTDETRHRRLADYFIEDGSVLALVVRLPGGLVDIRRIETCKPLL